jgi:hypothetical protein
MKFTVGWIVVQQAWVEAEPVTPRDARVFEKKPTSDTDVLSTGVFRFLTGLKSRRVSR